MDGPRVARATRIGGHAYRYLTAATGSGHVVSTFRHGFNLFSTGSSSPALVSIQSSDAPLHPWAVETPGVAQEPAVGAPFHFTASAIHFDDGLRVILPEQAEELTIRPYSKEAAEIARARSPLLTDLIEEERAKGESDAFQPRIDAILERWCERGEPEILLELVGLGTGSTPSGDDVLVGLLAGLAARGGSKRLAVLRVASIEQRSSLASAQMLRAALAGACPEPLRDLVAGLGATPISRAELASRVAHLAGQGATSGIAMLTGLAAALTA